jgi:hypothetical protein
MSRIEWSGAAVLSEKEIAYLKNITYPADRATLVTTYGNLKGSKQQVTVCYIMHLAEGLYHVDWRLNGLDILKQPRAWSMDLEATMRKCEEAVEEWIKDMGLGETITYEGQF